MWRLKIDSRAFYFLAKKKGEWHVDELDGDVSKSIRRSLEYLIVKFHAASCII